MPPLVAAEGQFGDPVEAALVGPVTVVVTPTPNKTAIAFGTVTVAVAGTPVQGPNLTVPNGFSLVVRQRVTQAGSPVGYVANSGANCAISANRNETLKGMGFAFFISNANLLWFDSDTAGTIFDLSVEQ